MLGIMAMLLLRHRGGTWDLYREAGSQRSLFCVCRVSCSAPGVCRKSRGRGWRRWWKGNCLPLFDNHFGVPCFFFALLPSCSWLPAM